MTAVAHRFTDKVAIVTGAASGIGLATALRLGREGARVVIADLHGDAAEHAAQQLTAAGAPDAIGLACDVSQEDDVMACVHRTLAQFRRLDVIVNNAGRMIFKPLEQHTGDDMLNVLKVDLLGAFFFTKQAFLHMPDGGAIVNVASVHALRTTPAVAPYAAAKAGLLSLTRSAAIEGRGRGIRSNAVLPGAVETRMLRDNPEVKAGIEHIDARELLQPDDIAASIAWLASDDARHVQGVSLVVDGGRLSEL